MTDVLCTTCSPTLASSIADLCPAPMARLNPNWRIAVLALLIVAFDQITKIIVMNNIEYGGEKLVVAGFFKLVHLQNTGAAWSMFRGNNGTLALVAFAALMILIWKRHHFDIHTLGGQISLGLIFGGIIGNLIDRVRVRHV